jgi:hypothetical protein
MFASQTDEQGGKKENILIQSLQAPYPHILAGKSQAEIDMFLRSELVGEKELGAVINQLKDLGKKESIMAKVENVLRDDDAAIGLDLEYDSTHIPQTYQIHNPKPNPIERKITKVTKMVKGASAVRVEQALAVI